MYQFSNVVVAAEPEPRSQSTLAALEAANTLQSEVRTVSAPADEDVATTVLSACDEWVGEGWNADMILVGSRRLSRAERVLIGPTATRLIRHSPVPVWCVRPGRIGLERTVAVGVDFDAGNAQALVELGVDLAATLHAGLLLVHVVDDDTVTPAIEQGVGSELQALLGQTDHGSIAAGVRPAITAGRVDDALLKLADAFDVDTLIMGAGAHPLGGLGEIAECVLPPASVFRTCCSTRLGSMRSLSGKRAVVWGLGRHGGGVAVVRYLLQRSAPVTVIDRASARDLSGSIDDLGEDITRIDFRPDSELDVLNREEFDLLVVNPAIPASNPELLAWRSDPSIEVTSEIGLLAYELSGCEVVGITGSNGKSTICQWTADLLHRLRPSQSVYLGGNFELGLSDRTTVNLLDCCPIEKPATAVLELSSFQLSHLNDEPLSPTLGVLTNLSPNHLDWHDSFDDYEASKRKLLAISRTAIDGTSRPIALASDVAKRLSSATDAANAALVECIVRTLGLTPSADDVVATQPIIPHRRRVIATRDGVTYLDDSAATTPESVIQCLADYGNRDGSKLVVIAGGRNKGFAIDPFAQSLAEHCYAVACIGECGPDLASRVAVFGGRVRSHRSLRKAVRWACKVVPHNGVVALSPGMASTDLFADYRDRAEQFRQILQNELN